MVVQVGLVGANFGARKISIDRDRLVWLTDEGSLKETDVKKDKIGSDSRTIGQGIEADQIILAGRFLLVAEGGEVRSHRIENGSIGSARTLDIGIQHKALAADADWLYVLDFHERLFQIALKDGELGGQPSLIATGWAAVNFTVDGGDLCWLDQSRTLRMGSIQDGKIAATHEVISDDWRSVQFSGASRCLYWIDDQGNLKRGKKLSGNGNHIHFRNDFYDLSDVNWVRANVRGPGEFGYYNTDLGVGHSTGVPYEPKHQDYFYSVEFTIDVNSPSGKGSGREPYRRAFMPAGNYFKVDKNSKLAVLTYEKGAHPDNLRVVITDFGF